MTPTEVKELLARYGVCPTKAKGQNFLLDERVAEREVHHLHIEPEDVVLEIGPGLGILTEKILPLAAKTICIELDPQIFHYIEEKFKGRVELIKGDALQVDMPAFDKLISNIPYSISSPLIFRILEHNFRKAIIMVQKEFAERMVAKPGSDEYSRLSVTTYYRARCQILEVVSRSKFWPQPEVDSAVVCLEPRPPPFSVHNERFFLSLVKILFQHRRKKIGTILRMTGQADKDVISALPYVEQRVEELSPEMIGELSDALMVTKMKTCV
ncbi:MAG: 16S rRNA (adenine(1518)-N(6)/adenine(1519)-N(6))-dimethyltransferase RsmA [Methanomassiliicoccales archaeon]